MPSAYTRDLATYWLDGYDWRAREAALNRFDQFVVDIDGPDIHFIHQRSPHPDAFPLVMTQRLAPGRRRGRTDRRRASGPGPTGLLRRRRFRLLQAAVHTAADPRPRRYGG
jgi:hypothetical protein